MKHDEPEPHRPTDDELRAELRGLRVESALPEEVASRLDARLAALQREHGPVASQGVDGAPLRRRPARVVLAAAAAALVAVGVGGVVVQGLGDAASPAGGESASRAAPRQDPPPAAAASDSRPPRLTRSTFAADVQAVLAERQSARALLDDDSFADALPATPACGSGVAPASGQQSFVGLLDGDRVLVVVDDARATAYACSASSDDAVVTPRPAPVVSGRLD